MITLEEMAIQTTVWILMPMVIAIFCGIARRSWLTYVPVLTLAPGAVMTHNWYRLFVES